LQLDLGFNISFQIACRCFGINAPELATPEGKAAHEFALTLADGRDFGSAMVAAGFARPYFGVGPKT